MSCTEPRDIVKLLAEYDKFISDGGTREEFAKKKSITPSKLKHWVKVRNQGFVPREGRGGVRKIGE